LKTDAPRPDGRLIASGCASGVREELLWCVDVRWFDEVHIKSRGSRGFAVLGTPVAGHGNEVRLPLPGHLAQAPGEFIPIHPRHPDIHERDVGPKVFGHLKCAGSIERRGDRMSPRTREQRH
jgi:hypothetical protein